MANVDVSRHGPQDNVAPQSFDTVPHTVGGHSGMHVDPSSDGGASAIASRIGLAVTSRGASDALSDIPAAPSRFSPVPAAPSSVVPAAPPTGAPEVPPRPSPPAPAVPPVFS